MSLRLLNCKAIFKTFLSFQDRGMTSAVSQNGTPTWPKFLIFFSLGPMNCSSHCAIAAFFRLHLLQDYHVELPPDNWRWAALVLNANNMRCCRLVSDLNAAQLSLSGRFCQESRGGGHWHPTPRIVRSLHLYLFRSFLSLVPHLQLERSNLYFCP